MRLDRFLTSQNIAARKQAADLCRSGKITVNGTMVKDASFSVDPEQDAVCVSGEPVIYKQFIYIMLNKPKGVICATGDSRHKTVIDLVPPGLFRRNLFPAGRLDIDTEGFVLITDDGDFAHRILSPKHHVPKTYEAQLEHGISDEEIKRFCGGVTLDDGTGCLPAELTMLKDEKHPLVQVVIFEGKYHQIKRMFEAVNNRVIGLKRVRIGGLMLDPSLASGEAREILHKEKRLILGSSEPEK